MSGPADGVMLHPDKVGELAGAIEAIARDITDELNRAGYAPALTLEDFGNLNDDAANGQLHLQFGADASARAGQHAERLAGVAQLLGKYSQAVANTDLANRARIAALHPDR